jgi:hypothetical protein
MKQRKRTTAAALFLSLCLAALSLSGCGLFDGLLSTALPTEYPFADQYSAGSTVLAGGADKIRLTWLYGSVHIRTHGEDTVEIREAANLAVKEPYEVHWWHRAEGEETVLDIAFSKSGVKDFGDLEKDLILLLPEKAIADLTVTVDTADVKVELGTEARVGKFLLTSLGGKVDVSLAHAEEVALSAHLSAAPAAEKNLFRFASAGRIGKLSLSTVYSDLDVTLQDADEVTLRGAHREIFLRGNDARKVDVSSSTGKTQIYLRDYTAITAASNRGAILMTLPSSRGFTLTVSPDAGGEKPRKVDVHFEGAQTEGNVTTVGDGSGSITVSTGGSLEVTPFEVSPLHSI